MKTELERLGCTIEPCGSRVTCDPAPEDSDFDFLVVAPADHDAVARLIDALTTTGLVWEGGEHYQTACANGFMSWRKGHINLICTSNQEFAKRHRAATALCKTLNVMDKSKRIALFQAVLYENFDYGAGIDPKSRATLVERFAACVDGIEASDTLPKPYDFYYAIKNEGAGTGWRYQCAGVGITDVKDALNLLQVKP